MLLSLTVQRIISSLVVLCSAAVLAESECPTECSCPSSPPLCARGVSWVLDHCGCCKVCAKQFNEDCSASEPCDHIKGLRCHLGAGGDPRRGLCRAEALGLPCEFDGRVYQHGEHFQPSCQHQCTCMNRVVGCMPLCPHQVPLPSWRCSRPQLLRPEGSCCDQWVCEDDNHISEEPEGPGLTTLPDVLPLPNHISPLGQDQAPLRLPGGKTYKEMLSFPVSEVVVEPRCFPQTSQWSECSVTCGMGLSSRVSNHNPECQPLRETRLCQVRPCDQLPTAVKKGKKCQRTSRPQEPVSLTFAGCSTAERYRPRSCGTCVDRRCCTPSLSRTVRLRFQCPDGEDFYQNVMWIQRCKCSHGCHGNPLLSIYNDIHNFRH